MEVTIESVWATKSVVCALNSATSAEVDIGDWEYVSVRMPATFDGFATISFLAADQSGGSFKNIYLPNGQECKGYATFDTWAYVGASLAPFRYVKAVFGVKGDNTVQTAAKTLLFAGK